MKLDKILIFFIICCIVGSILSFMTETEKMKFRHKKLRSHKMFLKKDTVKKNSNQEPTTTVDQFSDLAKETNILDMVPGQDSSMLDLKLGPGPVHYSGWVKFFKFASDENHGNKPSSFFKNLEFYIQSRKYPQADLKEKQDNSNKYIQNESYFYAMVFMESINILTSRLDKYQKTFDSMYIDLITPVVEDKLFIGGITDFGSFSEGFCFKIETSKVLLTQLPPKGTTLTAWVFCTESAVIIYLN